jgi:LacI family transcriptional regulator
MNTKKAPTMKDVAKEAGVALGTVSKVINGVNVGKEYKEKVEEAVKKLDYKVNTYARGLKVSHTQTITLIIPNLTNPFYAAFANVIEHQVYLREHKLILCCSEEKPEKEAEYLSLASQSKTDGIIALTYSDISNLVPDQIPLVVFDRYFEKRSIPRIASDNYSGGVLAVEKLVEFGCKNVAFIRFHSKHTGESDKRFDGYLDGCKKYNIKPNYINEFDNEYSLEHIKSFLEANEDKENHRFTFDGIFTNTDYHATIAMTMLQEMGYSIPQDIQIIGFDGIKKFYPSDEYVVSTITQPIEALAKKAVDIILEDDRDSLPTVTLLPVKYCYGGTTKE